MPRRISLALLVVWTFACRPEASVPPSAEPAANDREPPPIVDHGAAKPYWGTWFGPELRLAFAGPWVLIAPREAGPGAQPIELRTSVERREGAAFALQTSVAGRYAADFVRPSDWTLLVEDGELALAMGDEPLASYVASDEQLLVGPVMLGEIAIPNSVAGEDVLACLELASEVCRELEAEGPRAAGCREAQWGVCVAHIDRGQADPTVRAANATARTIHHSYVALRFAEGLRAAASATDRPAADALLERTRERARRELDRLKKDGPLPSNDPYLPKLMASLGPAKPVPLRQSAGWSGGLD